MEHTQVYNKRGPKVKLTDQERRDKQKVHSKKFYDTHKEYFVKYRQDKRQQKYELNKVIYTADITVST